MVAIVFGVGLALAAGFFWLRLSHWEAALLLGKASLWLSTVLLSLLILVGLSSIGRGGDAAMYAAIFVYGALVGVVIMITTTMIIAMAQGIFLNRRFWSVAQSGQTETIALLVVAFASLQFSKSSVNHVTGPNAAQQAQVRAIAQLYEAIPVKHRRVTSQQLDDWLAQERATGKPESEVTGLVPPEADAAIRRYEQARSTASREGSPPARRQPTNLWTPLVIGWAVGVFASPWVLGRKKRQPAPSSEPM